MSVQVPNHKTFSTTEEAVLTAFCYADIFSFALRRDEIRRYLPLVPMASDELTSTVDHLVAQGRLVEDHDYLALADRAHLIQLRGKKETALARKWEKIRRHLPRLLSHRWIKGALLTGSTAAGNAGQRDDVDLLLVLDRRRMWLCYLLFRLMVRRIKTFEVCPNYVVSEGVGLLPFSNLFTAVEWGMAIPLKYGPAMAAMASDNDWYREYIPNAATLEEKRVDLAGAPGFGSRLLSLLVFSPLGLLADRLERLRLKWRTAGKYQPRDQIYKPHPPTRQAIIFEKLVRRLDHYGLKVERVRRHIHEQKVMLDKAIAEWQQTASDHPAREKLSPAVSTSIERPAPSGLD